MISFIMGVLIGLISGAMITILYLTKDEPPRGMEGGLV